MITCTIFVVDDEQSIREGITLALEAEYQVQTFSNAESAIEAMGDTPPDLLLLDIGLPGMDGMQALARIKESYPDVLVVMITAFEDIKTVISAMKLGAYDYIVKPIHMDGLRVTIGNALETIRLRKEVQLLQERYLKENIPCFVGESNAIQGVMEFIGKVAKSPDTPILILGETGTGKELIASAIHFRSPNFKGPFMTVNCAAIPRDLIESELFGYEKGAFSGASASGKKGLIEQAADGTLFLDEVGDLSLEAQAKLLRFLELGEFFRVGGTRKISIRTRVVSATNKDIGKLINEEMFRNDLYYRLGVVKVQVPTLNERRDDIIPLAKHFLYEFSHKFDKIFSGLSPETERALREYRWTGNIRELKNIIEKGTLTGQGPELTIKDLGLDDSGGKKDLRPVKDKLEFPPMPLDGIDLSQVQENVESFYISEALRLAGGNESKAARLLNMNHHTFRYRRKKLDIS